MKNNLLKLVLVICSAIIVATADMLIKKVSLPETKENFQIWCFIGGLYGFQCYLAYLMFKRGNADLGVYACLFVVFYSILTCLFGNYFFNEIIGLRQFIGIGISLIGAVLLVL